MRYEVWYDQKSRRIDIRRGNGNWYTIDQFKLLNLAIREERRLKAEGFYGPNDDVCTICKDEWFIFQKAVEESQCVDFEDVETEILIPEIL